MPVENSDSYAALVAEIRALRIKEASTNDTLRQVATVLTVGLELWGFKPEHDATIKKCLFGVRDSVERLIAATDDSGADSRDLQKLLDDRTAEHDRQAIRVARPERAA